MEVSVETCWKSLNKIHEEPVSYTHLASDHILFTRLDQIL